MKYRLFYIDDVDFSDYVDTKKYSVNREDVIETWTDANKVVHGTVVRQKVKGNITLVFKSHTQYNYFVDTLRENKTGEGKYLVGVHVNNEVTSDMIEKFYAFMEFSSKVIYSTKAYNRLPIVIQVECTITEE